MRQVRFVAATVAIVALSFLLEKVVFSASTRVAVVHAISFGAFIAVSRLTILGGQALLRRTRR